MEPRAQPLGDRGVRPPPKKKIGRTTPTFYAAADCSARNWVYHPYFVMYNNLDQGIGPPTLETWLRPCTVEQNATSDYRRRRRRKFSICIQINIIPNLKKSIVYYFLVMPHKDIGSISVKPMAAKLRRPRQRMLYVVVVQFIQLCGRKTK